jgi:hypothetical protein
MMESFMPGPIEYDIFISYSSADVEHAKAFEEMLTSRGLKVWRDKTALKPGEHVEFVIPQALLHSKAVAILWSESSVNSEWVKHEASYAIVEGKAMTLSIAPFQYASLPAIYRGLNCGDLAATQIAKELIAAVEELKGHALALTLIGAGPLSATLRHA